MLWMCHWIIIKEAWIIKLCEGVIIEPVESRIYTLSAEERILRDHCPHDHSHKGEKNDKCK